MWCHFPPYPPMEPNVITCSVVLCEGFKEDQDSQSPFLSAFSQLMFLQGFHICRLCYGSLQEWSILNTKDFLKLFFIAFAYYREHIDPCYVFWRTQNEVQERDFCLGLAASWQLSDSECSISVYNQLFTSSGHQYPLLKNAALDIHECLLEQVLH